MPSVVIAVPVGLDAVKALPRNKFRTAAGLVNNNPVAVIYWATDDPSVSTVNGFPIFPRGSVTFAKSLGDDTESAYYVVSDLAASNVRAYESIVNG